MGLPAFSVSTSIATEILQGAIDKLQEARTVFLGGHTIATQELLLGLSVTGSVQEAIVASTDCKEGDTLVLTKPLGSGIIITALKLTNAQVPIEHFSMELVRLSEKVMLKLNAAAAKAMLKVGVHACTDVTGFGLCEFYDNIPYAQKIILFDPQTSGGLLISLASDKADQLIQELYRVGIRESAVIGHITQKEKATIIISKQ